MVIPKQDEVKLFEWVKPLCLGAAPFVGLVAPQGVRVEESAASVCTRARLSLVELTDVGTHSACSISGERNRT